MLTLSKNRSNGSIGDNNSVAEDIELIDVEQKHEAGRIKRLRELFFLQRVLTEKSCDSNGGTTLALSVHAIMLESGFVLLGSCSANFRFSKELPSISINYTLPDLIKISLKENKRFDYVTVKFLNLNGVVVVDGNLDGNSKRVQQIYLHKCRFLPLIDLVMDTLKFEKQLSPSSYRDVFMLWRMVKDNLVLPLLIDLCDKTGLESPPCLMSLPTELKLKILELLPSVSIGKMACVCKEMLNLASDNDLWRQKCSEEFSNSYKSSNGENNWKTVYVKFCKNKKRLQRLRRSFTRCCCGVRRY